MNKKVIVIGATVTAAILVYAFRDKLFNSASSTKSGTTASKIITLKDGGQIDLAQLEGFVLTSPKQKWIKIVNGMGVGYGSYQAYLNDGSPQTVGLSDFDIDLIPMSKQVIG